MTSQKAIKIACQNCGLQKICLPVGLESQDIAHLETIVGHSKPYPRGTNIYYPDDKFSSLYAIRSGSVKTYTIGKDGTEYVTGFYLPGELIGLDALSSGIHPCGAKTLETTTFCELPYSKLEDLTRTIPNITRQLLKIMSSELNSDEKLMLMIGSQSAEIKLISLFLILSNRLHRRGYSATQFNLSMSRSDIANFLGLAVETVSRVFKKLQEQGLIDVKNREITLLDMDKLKASVI